MVFRVELTQEGAVGLRSEQQARLAEMEQCIEILCLWSPRSTQQPEKRAPNTGPEKEQGAEGQGCYSQDEWKDCVGLSG